MTEKRFSIEQTMMRECIIDNFTGEQLDTVEYAERLCEVLNELAEEIEHIREYNNKLLKKPLLTDILPNAIEIIDINNKLEKENEQLKDALNQRTEQCDKYYKENEQLKQVSQDYEDNVSNWFIENWNTLTDEQKQSAHLELGIEVDYD